MNDVDNINIEDEDSIADLYEQIDNLNERIAERDEYIERLHAEIDTLRNRRQLDR